MTVIHNFVLLSFLVLGGGADTGIGCKDQNPKRTVCAAGNLLRREAAAESRVSQIRRIWFVSFDSEHYVAITPEEIRRRGLRIGFDKPEEFRRIDNLLGTKGQNAQFDSNATCLRIEDRGVVTLVDSRGVVKRGTRQYALSGRNLQLLKTLVVKYGRPVR